ncbi:phage tail protein [Mycetohabitans sp. B6]|uniref:phage tail protein n=1 Tax=Mycetohabitans sp. B6 TaxID=2841843 RepID=UPI001F3DFBD4
MEKKDISISLTDEAGKELLVTWNVSNAFPTKLTAPNQQAPLRVGACSAPPHSRYH